MRVQIGESEFVVYMERGTMTTEELVETGHLKKRKGLLKQRCRNVTICHIYESFGQGLGKPIAMGIAVCSPIDGFDKEAGQQVALRKALKDADFIHRVRQTFWNAYHNRAKKGAAAL